MKVLRYAAIGLGAIFGGIMLVSLLAVGAAGVVIVDTANKVSKSVGPAVEDVTKVLENIEARQGPWTIEDLKTGHPLRDGERAAFTAACITAGTFAKSCGCVTDQAAGLLSRYDRQTLVAGWTGDASSVIGMSLAVSKLPTKEVDAALAKDPNRMETWMMALQTKCVSNS